jgi:hypothetical protein
MCFVLVSRAQSSVECWQRVACRRQVAHLASSCHEPVLVDQSAEYVAPKKLCWIGVVDPWLCLGHSRRCVLNKGAVRTMIVVVIDEFSQNMLELTAMEHKQPVEALTSCGADEPLGTCIRTRGSNGSADDPDAIGLEHLVETGEELGVSVLI